MADDILSCPRCGARLRQAPDLGPGAPVMCPRCLQEFPVPGQPAEPEADKGPPPDGYMDRPVARPRLPEPEPLSLPRPPQRRLRQPLSSEFPVDLRRWFHFAAPHYGAVFGLMAAFLATTGFATLMMTAIPAGVLLLLLFLPAWVAGPTIVCLAQFRGERWALAEFFDGFSSWGSLVKLNALVALLLVSFLGPPSMVVAYVLEMGSQLRPWRPPPPEALWAALVFMGFCVTALTYLLVRGFTFAMPLIVDQRYGVMEAINGSWVMTRGHFWSLAGIGLLLLAMNVLGALACGVGLVITLPGTQLIRTAGYLLACGELSPQEEERSQEKGTTPEPTQGSYRQG